MSFALGNKPQDMTLYLDRDADFISTIRTNDGSAWKSGIVVKLILGDATWTATVVADEIRFNVDKVQVNAAIAAKAYNAQLLYVDGATEILWARGKVQGR